MVNTPGVIPAGLVKRYGRGRQSSTVTESDIFTACSSLCLALKCFVFFILALLST